MGNRSSTPPPPPVNSNIQDNNEKKGWLDWFNPTNKVEQKIPANNITQTVGGKKRKNKTPKKLRKTQKMRNNK